MNRKSTIACNRISKFVIIGLLYCFGISFLGIQVQAQTTINTTSNFQAVDSASIITFNFQNTNAFPVAITKMEGVLRKYGNQNIELWYKNTAINGAPGAITIANGWTLVAANNPLGIGIPIGNTTQNLFNPFSLQVPAGNTFGFALVGTSTGYMFSIGNVGVNTSISGGGCNVLTGPAIGFAGGALSPAPPTITGKAWLGSLSFVNGANCAGTPAVATISGPASICTNRRFSLSASNVAIGPGVSYQWQFFNTTTNAWQDIAGATSLLYTNESGNTAAVQYRFKTICSFGATESVSASHTVGVGLTMNGVYTINNAAPSSSTNFVSFRDAAAALQCGISGPVTLNVIRNNEPYTEAPEFGIIPGASATNRIVLNGNGATLQYLNSNTDLYILHLKGTRYMKVDSLHVRSLGSQFGQGITLSDTAKYDSIVNCFVDMRSFDNASSITNSCGIALSGLNTSVNYANSQSCYVGKNYILGPNGQGGPYFGISDGWTYVYNNNVNDSGNVIAYNTVENFGYFGITANSNKGSKVIYNDIHRTNKTVTNYFVGIRSWGNNYSSATTATNNCEIVGNRIHNPSINNAQSNYVIYGIQVYNNSSTINNNNHYSVLVANNAIYNIEHGNNNGAFYGIHFWTGYNNNSQVGSKIRVYHNTIDIAQTAPTAITYGISGYDYNGITTNTEDTVLIKNNLITINGVNSTANQYGTYLYSYNNSVFSNIEMARNNTYFMPPQASTQFHTHYFGTNYSTLAAFQAAYPQFAAGALSVDPQYLSVSTGDLTPMNVQLFNNGVNLQSDVPLDILGRPRSATPTPGAFEKGTDAGVVSLLSPVGTYCSSNKDVNVSIKNYGLTNINSVQIHWSLNGVLQTPVNYSGTLTPNAVANVTLGTGLFLPNMPVTVKAWTYLPNGQADAIGSNDTIVTVTQSSTSIPVDLGPDDTICVGSTKVLNAGYPGWSHLWNGNVTGQTRTVSQAGTYYVRVMALDGCLGFDTFNLSLRPLPIVNIGPDVEICWGQTHTYNAGHPGSTYLWDNGTTNQTRTVDTAGTYEVQVTDIHGCTGVDQASVFMKDMPLVDGINATHGDSGTYTFYPLNPQYIINYRWNFGDGSPEVTGYMVQHTYATLGIYTVTLYMEGECTGLIVDESRTVDVFVVRDGTTNLNAPNTQKNGIRLYPNPSAGIINISSVNNVGVKQIKVYNVLGQLIADNAVGNATNFRLNTAHLANGLYTVIVSLENEQVISQKFEVLH